MGCSEQQLHRCYELKGEWRHRDVAWHTSEEVLQILEDIRLSVSDGFGCLHDVMSDEDGCSLPFWNALWDLKRRPKSSLGIIFDQDAASAGVPVQIHGVIPGSPADVMGQLKGQDAILAVDSCVVDGRDAKLRLRGHDMIGTLVDVLVRRPDGETVEVQLQRTSAAHIYELGQLFDLLAAHEVLLLAAPSDDAGPSGGELQASLQAVRQQILYMERLRLTRESYLAAKVHNIQSQVLAAPHRSLAPLPAAADPRPARSCRRS